MTDHQGLLNLSFRKRAPLVLQTEASECGLASLAMVSGFHGGTCDLSELRRRHAITLKGATLKDLIDVADDLGLAARPLRLELDEVEQLQTPCILHWDLNHFVVLARCGARSFVIHDPAVGRRTLTTKELGQHFSGVALELTPTERFAPASPRERISAHQLLGRMQGLWSALGTLLLLALAIEALGAVSPLFLQWVVDHAIVSADSELLTTLAMGFGLMLILKVAIGAMRGWALLRLNASLRAQSRINLFTHLVNLPTAYFEARHVGDVMSRFGSQDMLLSAITTEFVEAVLDGLMAAVTFAIMVILAPGLAVLVAVAAVGYAILRWATYSPLREASSEQIVWAARRDSHFLETLRGIRTVKLFNAQEPRRTRWFNLVIETINRQLEADRIRLGFRTADRLIFGLVRILVIWLAARKVLDGSFTVGLVFAFLAYKDLFLDRVSELINRLFDLAVLRLHAERVADIALTAPEARASGRKPVTELLPATLELRNIHFRYGESDPWVLAGASERFRSGESVAIIGPSGQGKTTLLKILCGLLPPVQGEIMINGEPIRSLGLDRYRDMLGIVMQDDNLFSGSIADNICFFDDMPDSERIRSCAQAAAVHDDIMGMPMGYETLIGDMGTVLSGGQKQRILIARALYRRPSILVLDEATSHLDVERERAVNLALRQSRVTKIVIAHRPETIRSADRVLELRDGRLHAVSRVSALTNS